MSTDTTVLVAMHTLGTSLRELGQAAKDTYADVKKNLIQRLYDGDEEAYKTRNAGDLWNEELRFLTYVIQQGESGDDTSILSWGMSHKNLIDEWFIENLAPFWKAFFKLDPTMPETIMVFTSHSDGNLDAYCIGTYDTNDGPIVRYKKFDTLLNWIGHEIDFSDFSGGKRIL
jgi:hypothetical protein